jgi:DHA2 family multidrug resistance protein
LFLGSIGPEEARHRAIDILGKQVRAQAYSLAVADGFILIGWVVVAYLVMMLFLRPGSISYRDLSKMH